MSDKNPSVRDGGSTTGGPDFVMGGGGSMMQLVPPFDFQGVTMRAFPLRASLPRLMSFVDSYLNIIPREVGYFRPLLPYVYLLVINYGKMAVEAANMGWIAQNEIAFSVALEWFKEVDGKLVFHDFAYVSPFIYVDNDLSMTTGREVYGWPKSLISITPETTSWMENPRNAPRLATVSSMVFPELYAGVHQKLCPFLQIEQAPAPSLTQMMPDPNNPLFPWVSIPNAINSAAGLTADMWRVMNALGITRGKKGPPTPGAPNGLPIPEVATLGDMMKQLGGMLNPYTPNIYFNTINLKQFRDSTIPGAFCYQALTNAKMSLSKLNGFGLLGDLHMALGDISGGYRILLHQWPSHPIIDALGIATERQTQGDGVTVAELSPVCPMWMDVDMRYGKGVGVAWRARGQNWWKLGEDGKPPVEVRPILPQSKVDELRDQRYNTALGTSLDLTGPFDFPSATIRVLPLLAEHDKLQELCDRLFNRPLESMGQRFEAWGRYVYLMATSYEEMASLSNNVGTWADNDVAFCVPVKWFEKEGDDWVLKSVALLPVFSFADGTTVAITRTEVSGIPTQKAQIESPPDTWMDDLGPSDKTGRQVLSVTAQVLPVVGMGQPTSDRNILRISLHEDALPYNDYVHWRFVAEGWGQEILAEHARKRRDRKANPDAVTDLKALAAGMLTGQLPIRLLTLKQFRNASQPLKACYQSLTEIDRIIDRVFDLREIDARALVRIERYESCPIAQQLGLVPKWTEYSGATQVDVFQAMRPFWLKVSMHEDLGRRHFWRSTGEREWQVDERERHADAACDAKSKKRPAVGRSLVKQIDEGKPQRLFDHVRQWETATGGADALTAEQARAAVLQSEPQIALESILSNEWEHWGSSLWYQAYQEIGHRLKEGVRGTTSSRMAAQELKIAQDMLSRADDLLEIGRTEAIEDVRTALTHAERLVALLKEVEDLYYKIDEALTRWKTPGLAGEVVTTELNDFLDKLTHIQTNAADLLGDKPLNFALLARQEGNFAAPLLDAIRRLWEHGKEHASIRFSKIVQKPEHFLRRDLFGTEQHRMDKEHATGPNRLWYVGPALD